MSGSAVAKLAPSTMTELLAAGAVIVYDSVLGGGTVWQIAKSNLDGTWTVVTLPASATSERPRPICLTEDLWFVANVGGFPDPTSQSFGSECNRPMLRSDDTGATWAPTTVGDETCLTERDVSGDEINGLSRVARAADGRIWAVRKHGSTNSHPIRCDIYYSDSDGEDLTWVLSSTLTLAGINQPPFALLCHPTDPNIVVLISSETTGSDDRTVVYSTQNRGASWTKNNPTVASGNNFRHTTNGASSSHLLLPTGRLVISNRRVTSEQFQIYTSDNYGLTWQLRYTETLADEDVVATFRQYSWLNGGETIVGMRFPADVSADLAVMVSSDYGTTWTPRTVNTLPTRNDNDYFYSPATDTIIAQCDNNNVANRIMSLADATGVGVAWTDVTGDLPLGDSSSIHWEGMASIPGLVLGTQIGQGQAAQAKACAVHVPIVGAACSRRHVFGGGDFDFELETFEYDGDGSGVPRQLLLAVVDADLAIIFRSDAGGGESNTSIKGVDSVWGTYTARLSSGVGGDNFIPSINSLGIIVSNLLNTIDNHFHGIVIKDPARIISRNWTGQAGALSLTGFGFRPAVAIATNRSNVRPGVIKTTTMPGAGSLNFGTGGGSVLTMVTDEIVSLDADGVSFAAAGAVSGCNEVGDNHYGVFISEDAPWLHLGSYLGTGIAKTILSEDCLYAMIMGDIAQDKVNRINTLLGDNTKAINSTNPNIFSDGITTMNPLAVGAHARVNQAASTPTYYFMAFTDPSAASPELVVDNRFPNAAAVLPGKPPPGTVSR